MSNKTILIVEDDPDVRLGYCIRLRAHNYDTCFAADALACLSEARKHQPHLIILDLGLPDGDGYRTLDLLKSDLRLSLIPVVVVSARDRRAHRRRSLHAGAQAFLQKPVDNGRLLSVIAQLLEAPRGLSPQSARCAWQDRPENRRIA